MVIIFSFWKTMMGSAVVSLPWAFQQAGLVIGCFITFTSFLVSYYTCYLIVRTARRDSDFFDTVYRYYGKSADTRLVNLSIDLNACLGAPGYYTGSIMLVVLLFGVLTVYFVICT